VQRIRSVKPTFFTSDDVCALSPLARLLYIGTWCEADREGRFAWSPATFKRRYLPTDECDIQAVCNELLARGLVVLYGDGLAYIPTFNDHQIINPKEAHSRLPEPEKPTRAERVQHASVTVPHPLPSFLPSEKGGVGENKVQPIAVKRDLSAAFQCAVFRAPQSWHDRVLAEANGHITHADLRDGFYPWAQKQAEATRPDVSGKRIFGWLDARLEDWRKEREHQRIKAERAREMAEAEAKRRELFG
jgi:hypothetical protein